MPNRQSAVIFGAPRSGTTSLWRYLAQHPDIAESRVKELNFFLDPLAQAENYEAAFPGPGLVTLEASPVYFHEHAEIAPRLGRGLPDARLVCILREPAARLVAAYRSERDWHGRVAPGMDFARYAGIVATGADPSPINPADREAAVYVRDCSKVGLYADILAHYLEYYRPEQIQVHFLDEMESDPARVVARTCAHIGVDPARMPAIEYKVENQGVNVRNLQLFHALRSVNQTLEPVLNRAPRLRHFLKDVHQRINGAPKDLHGDAEERGKAILRDWYAPHNRRLAEMLERLYPGIALPAWVNSPG